MAAFAVTNSGEGGTNGTAVTTGNSGGTSGDAWDAVTIAGTSAVTYDTTHPANGLLSLKHALDASGHSANVAWTSAGKLNGAQTEIYGRRYFLFGGFGTGNVNFIKFQSSGTNGFQFGVSASGKVATVIGAAASTTGTVGLSANTMYRLEFHVKIVDGINDTMDYKLYLGNSTTPLETRTPATGACGIASVDTLLFGNTTGAAAANLTYWLDDGEANSVTYPGPSVQTASPADYLGTVVATDSFTETVTSGWDVDDQGDAWTSTGAGTSQKTGTAGQIAVTGVSTTFVMVQEAVSLDQDVLVKVTIPAAPSVGTFTYGPMCRSNGGDRITAVIKNDGTSTPSFVIKRRASNVSTDVASGNLSGVTAGDSWWVWLRVSQSNYYAMAWKDGTTQPTSWTISAVPDSSPMLDRGQMGLIVVTDSSFTGTATLNVTSFQGTCAVADQDIDILIGPQRAGAFPADFTYINDDFTSSRGGVWFGMHTKLSSVFQGAGQQQADYATREALIGRKLDFHMRYWGIGEPAANGLPDEHWSLAVDGVPFVELSYGPHKQTAAMIPNVASGSLDATLIADALAVKALPGRVFMRPWWEMNLTNNLANVSNYGGDYTKFDAAWHRLWTIFFGSAADWAAISPVISGTPVGASHSQIKFMWCPGHTSTTAPDDPRHYYPTRPTEVDWIGLDAYPKPGVTGWVTIGTLLTTAQGTAVFDWYDTFKTYGKPMRIGETGVLPADQYGTNTAQTRAAWWSAFRSSLKSTYPLIRAILYYENAGNTPGWLFDQDDGGSTIGGDTGAAGIAAFQGAALDPYFYQEIAQETVPLVSTLIGGVEGPGITAAISAGTEATSGAGAKGNTALVGANTGVTSGS